MNFKRHIIAFICFWITTHVAQAQITYGKITYERKTNLYKKFKNNGDVKEWLREEDKNKVDVFELYFDDSLSVFKPQESDLVERMSWATSKNVVYQNYTSNKRLTEKKIWGETLVSDTVRSFKWKITESKRNICGYQCRKPFGKPTTAHEYMPGSVQKLTHLLVPRVLLVYPELF